MLRDNRARARAARLLLMLLTFFAGAMALASVVGSLQADWTAVDRNLESGSTTVIYWVYGLTGLGYFLLLPANGVAFLLWLHRAYTNLHLLPTVYLRYATAWAVGAWFVPLLNLVLPYNIVREVWLGYQHAAFGRLSVSATLVGWWWAAVLGQVLVAVVASRLGSAFNSQPIVQDVSSATLFDASTRLLAPILTWHVIGRCAWFEEQMLSQQLLDQLGQPAPTDETLATLAAEQSDYGQPEGY